MTHFDETSGVIPCATPWGRWYQTMEEVTVEVDLPEGTAAKLVKCTVAPKRLKVLVKGELIMEVNSSNYSSKGMTIDPKQKTIDRDEVEGEFPATIQAEESVWTIEDKRLLRIVLPKVLYTADQCWRSLLKGQYEPDVWTYDQMEKKLTLQRYQFEMEQGWGDAV